ncbi:MAG: hypothetical protein ACRDCN_02660 [Tannerellaceae bacterium]
MIIDIFGSLKENLNKKVRNPFFGTLTIVFVLQNWQLFYSLLFFDSSDNRTVRIDIIESYITQKGGTTKMFLLAVLCSFIVMTISYSLLNASAFISNFFDARVHPWIVSLATKEAKIVTKEKYELLAGRYAKLENQLDDERKKRYEALLRAEDAEMKLNEKVKLENENNNARIELTKKLNRVINTIRDNSIWRGLFPSMLLLINNDQSNITITEEERLLLNYLLKEDVLFYSQNRKEYLFSEFGQKVRDEFLNKNQS